MYPIIYEEPALSEKIPIKYHKLTEDKLYNQRVIYESYKPSNFREMQDYMNFILNLRKITPNCIKNKKDNAQTNVPPEDLLNCPEVSQEIKNYYNSDLQTQMPKEVKAKIYKL